MLLATEKEVSRNSGRFSIGIALAAIATVFAGFAPSYFLKFIFHSNPGRTPVPLTPLIHVHALVFTTWIIVLLIQSSLGATGRISMHRRLGVAAGVLPVAMIGLGLETAIRGVRDGWNPGGPYRDALEFMIAGIGDLIVFGSFIAAGFVFRRRAAIHQRLMILGTLGLMWPAITRMPFVSGKLPLMLAVFAALLFASAVRDKVVDNRIHPISLWGPMAIMVSIPARAAIAHTVLWHSFATWLIR
jgi:hypothetical protein